jgi:F420H(2)-dependent quinone reductase
MNWFTQFFIKANTLVYQKSGGRLGHQMANQKVLLLTTVGRKSGKAFTTPLAYFRDDENYLVVASNWGQDHAPNWYLNLLHQPQTTIQVGSSSIAVQSHPAQGQEYQRLWEWVCQKNPIYRGYRQKTKRHIPIVILTPI